MTRKQLDELISNHSVIVQRDGVPVISVSRLNAILDQHFRSIEVATVKSTKAKYDGNRKRHLREQSAAIFQRIGDTPIPMVDATLEEIAANNAICAVVVAKGLVAQWEKEGWL